MARQPDMPCASCGRLMYRSRSSLPEGQATCRPCRAENAVAGAPTHCAGCNGELTVRQRRARGSYCSRRCAYATLGPDGATGRDYKRRRTLGLLRPLDVHRDWDEHGYPIHAKRDLDRPAVDDSRWLQGPSRAVTITRRLYDDGRDELRCPWCWTGVESDGDSGWCRDCALSLATAPRGRTL